MATEAQFSAVVIDLSGVLYVDKNAIPGSIEALQELQHSGLPHCFLTNTTRQTRKQLQQQLLDMGFNIPTEQLLTAASAARQHVEKHHLRPHLLIHPDLQPDFDDLDCQQPNCVVMGDAGTGFTYQNLNAAFRVLMENKNAPLISMGSNRYFKEADGLSLDMGPFVAALEFASNRKAIVTGKPSETFFQAALDLLGAPAEETVMIGDDLENDVGGAQTLDLAGVLVRTGKYCPADDSHPHITANRIVENFSAAINWILNP